MSTMTDQNTDNPLDLKRILFKVWDHRLFVIVSLFSTLVIAYLFIKFSSKKYEVNAVILIKTETSSSYANPNDLLNVYDILNPNINLQNELNVLQSSTLIKEVFLSGEKEEISLYMLDNEEFHGKINNFSISGKYRFGEPIENDQLSFKLLLNSSYIH